MNYLKDPSAELDWVFDWSPWLASGETITGQTITADPGITVAPSGKVTTLDGGRVRVWLGGGAVGQRYSVACRVTTTAGRVDERTIRVTVTDR